MNIVPIAEYHTILEDKFGLPRQSGLADYLEGTIIFKGEWADPEALRGLELFSHIWTIWGFHLNEGTAHHTVRPPRLGGNRRVGVFASRSPFRPNGLGISAVEIVSIDTVKSQTRVRGADLADGTPIYDIKPYLSFSDSHPDANNGFAETTKDYRLQVIGTSDPELIEILSQDPRPAYQDDPQRIYKIDYRHLTIAFRVRGTILEVLSTTE